MIGKSANILLFVLLIFSFFATDLAGRTKKTLSKDKINQTQFENIPKQQGQSHTQGVAQAFGANISNGVIIPQKVNKVEKKQMRGQGSVKLIKEKTTNTNDSSTIKDAKIEKATSFIQKNKKKCKNCKTEKSTMEKKSRNSSNRYL